MRRGGGRERWRGRGDLLDSGASASFNGVLFDSSPDPVVDCPLQE